MSTSRSAWRARQREEQQRRQVHRVGVPLDDRGHPRRVVRTEQVELRFGDRSWVAFELGRQHLGEGLGGQRLELLVAALGDLGPVDLARGEAEDRLGDRVVHHGVELVALQPAAGVPPDLADEVRARVHRAPAAASGNSPRCRTAITSMRSSVAYRNAR